MPPVQGVAYRHTKRGQIVFADDSASTRVQHVRYPLRISASGDAKCGNVQAELADQGQRFSAAEGGQLVIGDDEVPDILIECAPHFGPVENPSHQGCKTTTLEMPDDQLTVIRAVFNHEDAQWIFCLVGRRILTGIDERVGWPTGRTALIGQLARARRFGLLAVDRTRLEQRARSVIQQRAELGQIVFQDVRDGSHFTRGLPEEWLIVGRHDDNAAGRMNVTNGPGRLESAEVGQPDVHRNVIRLEIARHLNSGLTRGAFNKTVALSGQQLADHGPHARMVIDNHHFHSHIISSASLADRDQSDGNLRLA